MPRSQKTSTATRQAVSPVGQKARPVPSIVIQRIESMCQLAFQEERGRKFNFPSEAAARSCRQNLYEVRRYLRNCEDDPKYRPIFESHVKIIGSDLHIGPHPLSYNDEVKIYDKEGNLVPLVEEMEKFLPRKDNGEETFETRDDDLVQLPFTEMECFFLAALYQQALAEIRDEKNLDYNKSNELAWAKPEARKRACTYFGAGHSPDQSIPEVEIFYNDNAKALLHARKSPR